MSDKRDEAQLTTIVTTEHFTLQTARGATINQANGRMAAYLGVVSSSLIALAFVGQIAGVDDIAFRVFGLVLLLPLSLIGIATFECTLQLAIEESAYAKRINTLRRFYFRPGMNLDDYLMTPVEDDDLTAVLQQGGLMHQHRRWQAFLTNAWMAAIINSFLTGVLVGFIVRAITGDFAPSLVLGALGFVVTGPSTIGTRCRRGAGCRRLTPEHHQLRGAPNAQASRFSRSQSRHSVIAAAPVRRVRGR